MPPSPFDFFPYRVQPWALDSLQRLHPKLVIMPTYTITSPCYHLPPSDSLGGSPSTSLSVPKRQAAAQCREQVAAGARNRTFGTYRPILKQPFPSSHFNGTGNTSFSCDKFTKVVWCLEVSLCSVRHGEADLALLGKLFHAAKTAAFHPMSGICGRMAENGSNRLLAGSRGNPRRNRNLGSNSWVELACLSAAGDGFSACNYCNVKTASGYHFCKCHLHKCGLVLKNIIHLLTL